MTKRDEDIFRLEYQKWLKELCGELIDYRESIIEVMKDKNLQTFDKDSDFIEMAKEAFFHKVSVFYQQEAAIEQAKIITGDDE